MNSVKFEMFEWAAAGNKLLERSREQLSSAPSEKVQALAKRIPEEVISSDSAVVLVFAGQYSAGKSTTIKVLTGQQDIPTGGGITTEETQSYDWQGVSVVDTPGIHTVIRPDHDEISYRAIASADLLVFMVTNELFDPHLASHFRKLAIERNKAHEMMLVVNKMRRESGGNSAEVQGIKRNDLRKVLAPFTPEDLLTSFIDAEAALESKVESDESVADILWEKSGVEPFILSLNKFVRDKGLTGKYTTALYNLEQVLQEALAAESSGDKDIDSLEELLLQRRRALLETQNCIPGAVECEVQQSASLIRQEGHRVADLINGSAKQKEVDRELQDAQDRVQVYAEELGAKIQAVIGKYMKDLDERVEAIANCELAKELLPRLMLRLENASISPETVSKLKKSSDVSGKLGGFLVRNSFNSRATTFGGLFKLNQYSGTATHGAVKAVGHFFGKSFKPWEAVKWTRAVANVGRVFAVAGTVVTFILQIKADSDATQLEKDLRESRSAVRSGFNDAAHVIEMHYDQATDTYIAKTLTSELEAVDEQLAELRNMQTEKSALFSGLLDLLDETMSLILDLHASSNVDSDI